MLLLQYILKTCLSRVLPEREPILECASWSCFRKKKLIKRNQMKIFIAKHLCFEHSSQNIDTLLYQYRR